MRPQKTRRIERCRGCISFVPTASNFIPETGVRLGIDELEAMRLADVINLSQEKSAERMAISRATFGRILERAHRTVATALVNGQPLIIAGGNIFPLQSDCDNCGYEANCRHRWGQKKKGGRR